MQCKTITNLRAIQRLKTAVFLDIFGQLFSGALAVRLLFRVMKASAIEPMESKRICKNSSVFSWDKVAFQSNINSSCCMHLFYNVVLRLANYFCVKLFWTVSWTTSLHTLASWPLTTDFCTRILINYVCGKKLLWLRRGYTWRLFWRRLTRPFCQYLAHASSNAKSLCL